MIRICRAIRHKMGQGIPKDFSVLFDVKLACKFPLSDLFTSQGDPENPTTFGIDLSSRKQKLIEQRESGAIS